MADDSKVKSNVAADEARTTCHEFLKAAGITKDGDNYDATLLANLGSQFGCVIDEAVYHAATHASSSTSSNSQSEMGTNGNIGGNPDVSSYDNPLTGTDDSEDDPDSDVTYSLGSDEAEDASTLEGLPTGNSLRKLVEQGKDISQITEDGECLLSLASANGYLDLVQVMLAMNPNSVDERGPKNDLTPLMEAVINGHEPCVRTLVEHGADITAQSENGNTPLHFACANGHVNIARYLIEKGALIEDQNENGHTPLMEAASNGLVDVARLLLEKGAGINAYSSEFKESALTLACYKGHYDMVQFLLSAGADQDHQTEEMHTALMEACMDGHYAVAKLLIDSGAKVNMPSESFESPLTLAACGGHLQLANLLVEKGASLEEVNDEGYSPLMEAAREGHEAMVMLLVNCEANVNALTEETLETALTLACYNGFTNIARYLLEAGADVNAGGSTPLMEAAHQGHKDLVEFLISRGADVHLETAGGDTALSFACENGHNDVAEILLNHGAELEHESEGGHTPLMKAARAGHVCTVQFLVSKGADVNRLTANEDHTVLSLACAGDHKTVVELLLEHQADPSIRLKDGSNALIEATKSGNTQIVRLLLDYSNFPGTNSSEYDCNQNECHNGSTEQPRVPTQALPTLVPPAQHQLQCPQNQQPPDQPPQPSPSQPPAPTPAAAAGGGGTCQAGNHCIHHQQTKNSIPCVHYPRAPPPASAKNLPYDENNYQQAEQEIKRNLQKERDELLKKRTKLIGEQSSLKNEHLEQIEASRRDLEKATKDLKPKQDSSNPEKPQPDSGQKQPPAAKVKIHAQNPAAPPPPAQDVGLQPVSRGKRSHSPSIQSTKPSQPPTQISKPQFPPPVSSQKPPSSGGNPPSSNQGGSSSNKPQPASGKPGAPPKSQPAANPAVLPKTDNIKQQTLNNLNKPQNNSNNQSLAKTSNINPALTGLNFDPHNALLDPDPTRMLSGIPPGSPNFGMSNSQVLNSAILDKLKGLPESEQKKLLELTNSLASAIDNAVLNPELTAFLQFAAQKNNNPPYKGESAVSKELVNAVTGVIAEAEDPAQRVFDLVTQGHDKMMSELGKRVADLSDAVDFANTLNRAIENERGDELGVPIAPVPSPTEGVVGQSSAGSTDFDDNSQQPGVSTRTTQTALPPPPPAPSTTTTAAKPAPARTRPAHPVRAPLVEVNAYTESNHDTPLTIAAASGNKEIVRELLLSKADIEHKDKKGFTPLILAASGGHVDVVRYFLDHNVSLEATSERTKDTALSLACSGGKEEVVRVLLEKGANIEHRNVSDYTPLSLAASGGYIGIIKLLLDNGAEINSRTGSKLGISPLMLAAMNGHVEAVKLLLDNGSDINAHIESNKNTALTLACYQGRHEVVSLLLERRANMEHRAKSGLTPLMEAASGGYAEVGRVLLDHGAEVNAPPVPASRDTALTIAADKGHYNFCEVVVARGANVEARNKKGGTPLWLACNGGHLDVAMMLVTSGADVDAQDNRKISCLMAAFRRGHVKVLRYLVKKVSQFPSNQECLRYIATLSDVDLIKRCNQCLDIISNAKDKQAEQANKNAMSLLEELDEEKRNRAKLRKEQAAKKREKKQKKAQEKKQKENKNKSETKEENKSKNKKREEEEEEQNDDDNDEPDPVAMLMAVTGKDPGAANSKALAQTFKAISSSQQAVASGGGGSSSVYSSAGSSSSAASSSAAHQTSFPRSAVQDPAISASAASAKAPAKATTRKQAAVSPGRRKAGGQKAQQINSNRAGNSTAVLATSQSLNQRPNQSQQSGDHKPPSQPLVSPTTDQSEPKQQTRSSNKTSPPSSHATSFSESANQQSRQASNQKQPQPQNPPPQQPSTTPVKPVQSVQQPVTPSNSTGKVSSATPRKTAGRRSDEGTWKEVTRKTIISKKTTVPVTAISRVIGRGGCNINAIREGTGAHIEIDKQQKGQTDRVVNIRGTTESVKWAEKLIDLLIQDPNVDIAEHIPKTLAQAVAATATTTTSSSGSKKSSGSSGTAKSNSPAANRQPVPTGQQMSYSMNGSVYANENQHPVPSSGAAVGARRGQTCTSSSKAAGGANVQLSASYPSVWKSGNQGNPPGAHPPVNPAPGGASGIAQQAAAPIGSNAEHHHQHLSTPQLAPGSREVHRDVPSIFNNILHQSRSPSIWGGMPPDSSSDFLMPNMQHADPSSAPGAQRSGGPPGPMHSLSDAVVGSGSKSVGAGPIGSNKYMCDSENSSLFSSTVSSLSSDHGMPSQFQCVSPNPGLDHAPGGATGGGGGFQSPKVSPPLNQATPQKDQSSAVGAGHSPRATPDTGKKHITPIGTERASRVAAQKSHHYQHEPTVPQMQYGSLAGGGDLFDQFNSGASPYHMNQAPAPVGAPVNSNPAVSSSYYMPDSIPHSAHSIPNMYSSPVSFSSAGQSQQHFRAVAPPFFSAAPGGAAGGGAGMAGPPPPPGTGLQHMANGFVGGAYPYDVAAAAAAAAGMHQQVANLSADGGGGGNGAGHNPQNGDPSEQMSRTVTQRSGDQMYSWNPAVMQ